MTKKCLTSIVFVPDDLAKKIQQTIIEPLWKIDPYHHYLEPGEMHLTIKGIRTIHNPPLFNKADIRKVDELFTEIIPAHQSFCFSFEEIVLFPTSVSLIGYSDERLQHLVQDLDIGLKRVGVPDNKKYISDSVFFGNITLCRFVQEPSHAFQRKFDQSLCEHIGDLKVRDVHLLVCNAVCARESQHLINSYRLRINDS